MTYQAAERQARLDHNRNAEADARLSAAHSRHFGGGCPSCGGVPDGMQWLDADDIVRVLGIRTEAALWDYLRDSGTWYRCEGSFNIFYPCWQCGPEVPPAEYQPLRITGGKQ